MEINIIVFGQIVDFTGKPSWKISGVKNTDELMNKLALQFPELPSIIYSIAVNKNIIQNNTELNQDDTVALLPPYSGG